MSNFISSLAWVRRGVAATTPSQYVLDDKELERVAALAEIELKDARAELERASRVAESMGDDLDDDDHRESGSEDGAENGDQGMEVDQTGDVNVEADGNELAEYKLDEYSDDDDEPGPGIFSNIKGLTFHRNNEDDPYITLKDDEDEDQEALQVRPGDNMIVTAKTSDEISQLEIYVYDESEENLYAHHDLMLPNYPLCLEWLDFPPSSFDFSEADDRREFGNYVAVGTLDPEIEIWSLDVIDAIYPDAVLGRPGKADAHGAAVAKSKKKRSKRRKHNAEHHVDAVIALSWNKNQRNLLASASADCTVKLWDLSRCSTMTAEKGEKISAGVALRSFDSIHTDKIQTVQWNPTEPSVLLTGSYDCTMRMFDSRAPDNKVGVRVPSVVEALRWDPWVPHSVYASFEDGHIRVFDARTFQSNPSSSSDQPVFTIAAHDGPASALDINPHIRGCLLTGGGDKLVKVWSLNHADSEPYVSLVTSRDLGVGKVFSASFSPDDPLTLAAAGSAEKLQIWDVAASQEVRKVFADKLREAGKIVKERRAAKGGLVGVVSDGEDSDEE